MSEPVDVARESVQGADPSQRSFVLADPGHGAIVRLDPPPNRGGLPPPERRCRATSKRTGVQCGRWGHPFTEPPQCHYHGLTEATKVKARRNMVAQEAAAIVAQRGEEIGILESPVDSLLRVGRRVELVCEIIGARLDENSDADPQERMALLGSYNASLDAAGRLLAKIVALGLTERKVVAVEQGQADAVAGWLSTALDSDVANLSYEQVEAVRSAFADAIRASQADGLAVLTN